MSRRKQEVYLPVYFIGNDLVWGWVPFKRWNPVHWFFRKRRYV